MPKSSEREEIAALAQVDELTITANCLEDPFCELGAAGVDDIPESAALTAEDLAQTQTPAVGGKWGDVIKWPLIPVSMANLPDGRLLSWSGGHPSVWRARRENYNAIWDPRTNAFSETHSIGHNMFCAGTAMSIEGKVFSVGGHLAANSPEASQFDWRTGAWTADHEMTAGRWYPTTLTLPQNEIYAALGRTSHPGTSEVWNEDSGWRLSTGIDWNAMVLDTYPESQYRSNMIWPFLHLAPNGKLFHSGPTPGMHWIDTEGSGSWEAAGQVPTDAYHILGSSTNYAAGKILTTGGLASNTPYSTNVSTSHGFRVDLNGASPVVERIADMHYPRKFHNSVVLPTGEVVVIGGNTNAGGFTDAYAVKYPEIWNSDTGQWRLAAPMEVARNYHSTALLLADGRVIAGGGGYGGARIADHADAEIWSPPYLFEANGSLAARPVIEQAPESVAVGAKLDVRSSEEISHFSMIRLASTTHQVNTDQRYLKLTFRQTAINQYSVDIPENANIALPGYWMLFAVNPSGVPSESHVFKVNLDEYSNIALGGTASQISDFNSTNTAKNAIDGNRDGRWSNGSITHSKLADSPWWQLDLGQISKIDDLVLYNRTDCCSERLNNFHVFISETPIQGTSLSALQSSNSVWKTHVQGSVGRQHAIDVGGVSGRYLRIQKADRGYLALAEVEVFGVHGKVVGASGVQLINTESDNDWRNFRFDNPYDSTPAVVAGPVSLRDDTPVITQLSDINADGFRLKLSEWDYSDDKHGSEYVRHLALPQGVHDLGGLAAEARVIKVGHSWKTVSFNAPFVNTPAVLTTVGSRYGAEAVVVRTNRINRNTMQIRLQEEQASDQIHTEELVSFIAIDRGTGSFQGRRMVVGQTQISTDNTTLRFSQILAKPHLLASISSYRNSDPVSLRLHSVNTNNANLRLQEETSADTEVVHTPEWVSWVAIDTSIVPTEITGIAASSHASDQAASFSAEVNGTGTLRYSWSFGDGSSSEQSNSPETTHRYSEPGRYLVTLTVQDESGKTITHTQTHLVHLPLIDAAQRAQSSSTITTAAGSVWVVNPDNDSVTAIRADGSTLSVEVGRSPWAIAATADGQRLWVSNKGDATLSVINASSARVEHTVQLPDNSQPHGLVLHPNGTRAYVALEATANIAIINTQNPALQDQVAAGHSRPRHLSITPDGLRLFVSFFITDPVSDEHTDRPQLSQMADNNAYLLEMSTADLGTKSAIVLQYSTRNITETSGPGLPNYIGAVAMSPDGRYAYVPSKQDNILGGALRPGNNLSHDQAVRAISSRIDLNTRREDFAQRIDHDNASMATAAVYGPRGAYLFTALEGNRQIAVSDAYLGFELGRIDVGRAPQGLALSDDGHMLYVHNFLDRSVSQIDIYAIVEDHVIENAAQHTTRSVEREQLSAEVIKGKQLFYDSSDSRLTAQTYMSCASCHNDGDHDGRIWDFSQFGEGLRNTTSLRGKGNPAHGRMHWTGNFDEVHDFEGQIRNFNAGSGLMSDAEFNATRDPLGGRKAGRSADLDALAAYVNSLQLAPGNPYAGDSLSASARAGQQRFAANHCTSCHGSTVLTDSASAKRHDVGTIKVSSGKRLGAALDGFDTPTLLDLYATAPYLHDGSAATVEAAIQAHSTLSVSASDARSIAAYLRELPPSGVQVITSDLQNLAPQGEAQQSSTAYGGSASRANDNDTTSVYQARSVSHTARQTQPWWQVDLGALADVRKVVIFNRSDCCSARLNDFTVFASANDMSNRTFAQLQADNQVAKYFHAGPAAATTAVSLQHAARYVRIQLNGTNFLSLAEVQVWVESLSDQSTTTLVQPAAQHSVVGTAARLQLDANGAETDTLQYSASGLPAGLAINPSSGLISGTPTKAASFAVTVRATDGHASAQRSFTWQVSAPVRASNVLSSGNLVQGQLAKDQWAYYTIDASSEHSTLLVALTMLSADLDLYVRQGAKPTGHSENDGIYDCHSIRGENSDELCALNNNSAGRWHIAIHAYRAGSYTLRADLGKQANAGTVLGSAVPVQGLVSEKQWQYFSYKASTAATAVSFDLTNLSSDADLYVRGGAKPDRETFDCRSDLGNTLAENCRLDSTASTTWYVGVYGYQASTFTLAANDGSAATTRAAKPTGFHKSDRSDVVGGGAGGFALALLVLGSLCMRPRLKARLSDAHRP